MALNINSIISAFSIGKPRNAKVGVDIGDSFVKIVHLAPGFSDGKYELKGFGAAKIEGSDKDAKASAIKQAARDAKVATNKVNAAVSGQSVIVRYIGLPKMSRSELERAARFEAEKYLPFDINEIILDPHILQEEMGGGKMRVLLVAAKKKIIDEQIRLLKAAGFTPQIIDIDSFALINSFELSKPDAANTVALLNIGSKFSNINIIKNYTSFFMRDIAIGGNEFVKAASEKLGLDANQTEELIKNPQARQDELNKVMAPLFTNLLGEISLSFDYYENQLEESVGEVYVSGGACRTLGLDKFLNANLGKPVLAWSYVDKLSFPKKEDKESFAENERMFAVALGLALAPRKD